MLYECPCLQIQAEGRHVGCLFSVALRLANQDVWRHGQKVSSAAEECQLSPSQLDEADSTQARRLFRHDPVGRRKCRSVVVVRVLVIWVDK